MNPSYVVESSRSTPVEVDLSFNDRDRNRLDSIMKRAEEALDSLVEIGDNVRALRDGAPSTDDSNTAIIGAYSAVCEAIAAVRSIANSARALVAEKGGAL